MQTAPGGMQGSVRSVVAATRPKLAALKPQRVGRIRIVAMAADPKYDIAVKAVGNQLADCPFCHRALLTLEEKKVPYTKTLIDFDNKPQWLLDVNPAGSVPVMKDLVTGEWIVDSGVIVDHLEVEFPEPALGTLDTSPQIGLDVLPKFRDFIKSIPGEAAAREEDLAACLRGLDAYLATEGPFIGGATPCATDLAVMPRLYHMVVATRHFRNWEVPVELTTLKKYMDSFMARDSWKNTYYSPELVVAGWEKHGVKKA